MFSSYLNFAIEHSDSYRVMYTVAQPEPGQYTELETEISRSTDPIGQVVNSSVTAETMIGDPVNICYVL